MSAPPETDRLYALASIAGTVIGLLFGSAMFATHRGHPMSMSVASSAAAGALAGLVLPVAAMDFVEGSIHFCCSSFRSDSPSPWTPTYRTKPSPIGGTQPGCASRLFSAPYSR
ncbi:hypothetical protein [Chitinimonas koreensis]|uniref:hypothetical protein n=1 Tax=Chitinimonas koreensis TaxID=356302 RepID=UPI0012FA08EF|nr:hypothetical protein [Chitinimonas koreensis]QNM96189.1 hypothetical protein H9L41_20650 [Chitinimonas koreensis]